MPEHEFACRLTWTGAAHGPVVDYAGYSREWVVDFDGKPRLRGSAAPPFRGDAALHNPEELLVAALASCHCLSYLALAARHGLRVVAYEDAARGRMAWDRERKVMRFAEVVLHPRVTVAAGSDEALARRLHGEAHRECFIASSVDFPVENEPTIVIGE